MEEKYEFIKENHHESSLPLCKSDAQDYALGTKNI